MWKFVSLFVLFHHTLLPLPAISPSGQICIGQEDTHKIKFKLGEGIKCWMKVGQSEGRGVQHSLFCLVCWYGVRQSSLDRGERRATPSANMTKQWALMHPLPPALSHFHPAFYTPSGFKFFLWASSCPMQICPEGEIAGGGEKGVMEKMKEQIKRQTLTFFSCICNRKTHSMSKLQVCFKPATNFVYPQA